MKKTYPLTQSQYDVFTECLEDMTLSETNLSWEVLFPADTDPARLVGALRAIIAARPTLRTRYLIDADGNPRQYIDEEMEIAIHQLQMSVDELEDYIKTQLSRPYDLLGDEPLCRFAIIETEKGCHLLHSIHHTIFDGFAVSSLYLNRDLPMAYMGKPLRKESMLLCEYAEEEAKLVGTEAFDDDTRRYAEKFVGAEATQLLPGVGSCVGHIIECNVDMGDHDLAEWCRHHHLLPTALMQAAFSLVLSRWSGQRKVTYLSIRHGRVLRPLLSSYGLYANLMPVVIDTDSDMGVIDFINYVSDDWHSTLMMNNHSLLKFCEKIDCWPSVFFSYQGSMVVKSCTIDGKEYPMRQVVGGCCDDDLQCMIYLEGDHHQIHLEANDAIYDEAYLLRFSEAIKRTVLSMIDQADGKLKNIDVLPPDC